MGLGAQGRKRPPAKPAVALRSAPVLAGALALLILSPDMAAATWNSAGGGGGAAKAHTVGAGNTPTTSISGVNVTVSWSASSISGGGPNADGYIVKRYDTANNLQSIGANCSGTVTGLSCTENNVPDGDWKYSVTPTYQNWRGAESSQSATRTVTTAQVTSTTISKTTGCEGGYTKQGGTYYVYANATGNPSGVTADVSNITSGQTSVNLVAGSYTVDGVSYGYRSASLTANASLSAGAKSYTVTATDGAGANGSVTIDNAQPTASNIQLTNKAGGTAGRPEIGDLATYTFSEAMDPCSVVAGWNGTGTVNVVVRVANSGSTDPITVWNSTNTTQLPLGSVAANSDIVSSAATFGASGTPSTLSMSGNSFAITLGTASSGPRTSNNVTASVWTPSTAVFDWAGNLNTSATATEGGAADLNF